MVLPAGGGTGRAGRARGRISLRASYAKPATELAFGATRRPQERRGTVRCYGSYGPRTRSESYGSTRICIIVPVLTAAYGGTSA
eukprot:454381-Rhodomonas_salina.2